MPRNLEGLNPLAYCEFPPREVSLLQEVRSIITAARTRTCTPGDAEQAVINLIGREVERITDGVKEAGGRVRPSPSRHGFEELLTPRAIADAYKTTVEG